MQFTEEQLSEMLRLFDKLTERKANLDRFEEDSLRERAELEKEINDLKMFLTGQVIKEKDSDIIELGTRFRATLISDEFGEETDDYIISESNVKMTGIYPITPNTPFGKAVLGKKVGDTFEYQVNGFNNKGVVNEIYKVKKEAPKQKAIEK